MCLCTQMLRRRPTPWVVCKVMSLKPELVIMSCWSSRNLYYSSCRCTWWDDGAPKLLCNANCKQDAVHFAIDQFAETDLQEMKSPADIKILRRARMVSKLNSLSAHNHQTLPWNSSKNKGHSFTCVQKLQDFFLADNYIVITIAAYCDHIGTGNSI